MAEEPRPVTEKPVKPAKPELSPYPQKRTPPTRTVGQGKTPAEKKAIADEWAAYNEWKSWYTKTCAAIDIANKAKLQKWAVENPPVAKPDKPVKPEVPVEGEPKPAKKAEPTIYDPATGKPIEVGPPLSTGSATKVSSTWPAQSVQVAAMQSQLASLYDPATGERISIDRKTGLPPDPAADMGQALNGTDEELEYWKSLRSQYQNPGSYLGAQLGR